jgi:hypothetical protein
MTHARLCSVAGNQQTMKTVIAHNAFKTLQTTSALCKAANVTRGQLRLYEEQGLVAPQMLSLEARTCATRPNGHCD